MVCIIDDREDVWEYASNLIHVKPYHFFLHTGDINAPPGLTKCENDDSKEGFDFTQLEKNTPTTSGRYFAVSVGSKRIKFVNFPRLVTVAESSVKAEADSTEDSVSREEEETKNAGDSFSAVQEQDDCSEIVVKKEENDEEKSNKPETDDGNLPACLTNDQGKRYLSTFFLVIDEIHE